MDLQSKLVPVKNLHVHGEYKYYLVELTFQENKAALIKHKVTWTNSVSCSSLNVNYVLCIKVKQKWSYV